jgi:hypothetical protein
MLNNASPRIPWLKRTLLGILALLIAAIIWLPLVHLFFKADINQYFAKEGIAPKARLIANRHLKLWTDPIFKADEINKMRASNAEWDFMGRSFLVWSLANMGLRDPAFKPAALDIIDRITDETILLEKQNGIGFFLMNYFRPDDFVLKPVRSQFLDGEIAMMLASRRMLEEKEEYKIPLKERVDIMVERMNKSPVLSAESYQNEYWMFDNCNALAAIKISDFLDNTDHSRFLSRWISTAKEKLIHPETGLLISCYTNSGFPLQGPEGSSIWVTAHYLQIIDEEFARDQYQRAKKELARSVLGFGYSAEWPGSWKNPADIDSGPIVPVLEASAGASGLAIVGASAFDDKQFLSELITSLNLAAFPMRTDDTLKYCASNQVGDSALLYAMTLGPIWQKVKERK